MSNLDFNVLNDADSHREIADLVEAINVEGWDVAGENMEIEMASGKVFVRLTAALPHQNRE